MAKLKTNRGFLYIKELGGAVERGTVSFAARWLVQQQLIRGRVLDYGCGFGLDADHYGWEGFDPYYRQQPPTGEFDTIVCNYVLNMLTRASRRAALDRIQALLTQSGRAWLIVPRNIPLTDKVAMRKQIQNYVQLELPSVYADEKLAIYRMSSSVQFADQTDEIEQRLSRQ